MAENNWWEYVARAMDGMSALEAGRKAGFDASAFTRWKKGASPDTGFVVKFARAFDLSVVQALAAAGLITEEEANVREVPVGTAEALQAASTDALLDEVRRRIDEGSVTSPSDQATVVHGRFGEAGSRRYALDAAALERKSSHFDEAAASEELP